jgi:transcription elongation GreA/GreB family factor
VGRPDERVSKAFTKEDDDAPAAAVRRRGVPVPAPNYVTAAGLAAVRAELATATDPDRIRELAEHLATAVIVAAGDPDRVGFGARVTVADDAGTRTTYHIVGAIEAVPREHAISWQSPLARALLGARVGDTVTLPRAGAVEVVAIA